jgi:hypothetical protein
MDEKAIGGPLSMGTPVDSASPDYTVSYAFFA